jgi:hydrogenase maturation protein HypF
MREFRLCAECAIEYADPADRRFHAEPIACPVCGPRLCWVPHGDPRASVFAEDALSSAVQAIGSGGIVAVKGLGGYQLVCDAADEAAVARLRVVKGRPRKAFAVMAPNLAVLGGLVRCDGAAESLLGCAAAPIVLLPRRSGAAVAASVAPGLAELGVFLPCTPVHHLLLEALARPLVATSGNRGGAPIVIDDRRAIEVLGPVSDGVLGHNRPIWTRYDDSVARVVNGRPLLVRRARGYAPEPLGLPVPAAHPVIALGAQLKHTVTLAVRDRAVLGPYTGDLEDAETFAAAQHGIERLCRLQDVRPDVCAHDLHPAYLSTGYARRWPPECRVGVQHHHAHVVATAAEHGLTEPFVGLAFDGLGMGEDGTFWGGEVLLATYRDYRRVGRFGTAPMPGGAAAVRRPARMALGYLFGAEDLGNGSVDWPLAADLAARLGEREVGTVRAMVERGLNCPRASSAGRLFDTMAALLGLCDDNSYEGEAAVLLEAAAADYPDDDPFPIRMTTVDGLWVYDPVPTLRAVLRCTEPVEVVAARFHATIAGVAATLAERAAEDAGVDRVCLGGGVFQNRRLTEGVLRRLTAAGLRGYVGERVPVNDAGISYGQAVVAAARLG